MEPTLCVGAIVVINPRQEPEIGDISMYRSGDGTYSVIHRVVGKDENGNYIFQGDNVNHTDLNPVKPSQIQGTVVYTGNWFQPIYIFLKKGE